MIGHISSFFAAHTMLRDAITWMCRIAVGLLFIYSGFVKVIDPWGSLYKFEEYFAIFGFMPAYTMILAGVFLLCVFEFLCGVSLITGSFRRSAPILSLLFMLVMLPLTFWIMISNPVSDCGCFGEAYIISNKATFWKNVVLTVMIIWLIPFNRYAISLITAYLQWIQATASALFVGILGTIGYFYQPLIDFRQYKVGTEIINFENSADVNSDAEHYEFVYRKDGKEYRFQENDQLPDEDDGWEFVETKEMSATSNNKMTVEKNLTLWAQGSDEDVTHEVLTQKGKDLILFMPSVNKVSIASTWIINSLKDWADKLGIKFFAVVSGSESEIEEWKDLSLANYPLYTADDTQIKEVVRGNPGVVYVEDGIIKWKSTLRALPGDDFMASDTPANPLSFKRDNSGILLNITLIYLAVVAFLIATTFSGRFFRIMTWKKSGEDNTLKQEQ